MRQQRRRGGWLGQRAPAPSLGASDPAARRAAQAQASDAFYDAPLATIEGRLTLLRGAGMGLDGRGGLIPLVKPPLVLLAGSDEGIALAHGASLVVLEDKLEARPTMAEVRVDPPVGGARTALELVEKVERVQADTAAQLARARRTSLQRSSAMRRMQRAYSNERQARTGPLEARSFR